MATRLIQLTGLDHLSTHDAFPDVLTQTTKLIQASLRNSYKIGSFLSCQINDMLEVTINFASRKDNEHAYKTVEQSVQSYMEYFFGEMPNVIQIDLGKLLGQETSDVKEELLNSFKMFDEGYHYMKRVKEVILYQLVPLMLSEFQMVYDRLTQAFTTERFSQNPGFLLLFASKVTHMLLITSSSFLSFANLHSSDDNGGFSAFLVNQTVSAERKDYVQQEGVVLGNLLTLVDKLKPFIAAVANNTTTQIAGLDPSLAVGFRCDTDEHRALLRFDTTVRHGKNTRCASSQLQRDQ